MEKSDEHTEHKLLKILEESILDEQASTARYRHGLSLAVEPASVALFEKLVSDEEAHERVLKERYYAIKKQLGLKVIQKDTQAGE